MGIQRWAFADDPLDPAFVYQAEKSLGGDYVLFTDHEQVVAELEAKLSVGGGVAGAAMEQITKLATERDALRAELAAKSKDAARYRYIRDSTPADAVDLVTDWSDLELDQAIDYAMGEGNGR